jgi:hypothetical protein
MRARTHVLPASQTWLAGTWQAGEIGPAPHQWFASHDKLASWVTLCPGNNISARKRKHGRAGDAGTYIKPMLIQAAWNAIRTKGRLQARYSRLVRRFGGEKNPAAKKKAITAIAHTLLKIACQVLKSGCPTRTWARTSTPAANHLVSARPGWNASCTSSTPAAPSPSPSARRRPPCHPAANTHPPSRPAQEPPPDRHARPPRQTNQHRHRTLATTPARVRCRAPTRTQFPCQRGREAVMIRRASASVAAVWRVRPGRCGWSWC